MVILDSATFYPVRFLAWRPQFYQAKTTQEFFKVNRNICNVHSLNNSSSKRKKKGSLQINFLYNICFLIELRVTLRCVSKNIQI